MRKNTFALLGATQLSEAMHYKTVATLNARWMEIFVYPRKCTCKLNKRLIHDLKLHWGSKQICFFDYFMHLLIAF